MVPNVAGTGTSFKGAALYYLHDKRREGEAERLTSDRVAWSETRNLATDDPELAWKIMAATAIDQDRLKAEAGVKATGRKSAASVYAYSIAWHPEEAGRIGRSEMLRAAEESIRALGAQDRQAIIVAHNDEPQPHVHVILNRVSPDDGRMLGTSNDYRKLDAWALAYRRERGEEHKYCPARAEKADAAQKQREGQKAEFVRGEKSTPRGMEHDFAKAQAANENSAIKERDRQKALSQKLAADTKAMHARHRQEWTILSKRHQERKADIRLQADAAAERARSSVKEQFRPSWRQLFQRQWVERLRFDKREQRLAGKVENAVIALAHRRRVDPDGSRGFLSTLFSYRSQSARRAALEKLHALEKRELSAEERREVGRAIAGIKEGRTALLGASRSTFNAERAALIERQAIEREQNQEAWTHRKTESRRAFDVICRDRAAREAAKQDQIPEEAVKSDQTRKAFNAASRGRGRMRGRVRRRTISDDESSE